MGWQTRWWVHAWTGARGIGAAADDRAGVRSAHVDNVAELRRLVDELRGDPHVRRYQFGPYDDLHTGDRPEHCECGRELHGHRLSAASTTWRSCQDCPGHLVYRCRPPCRRVTVWPAPGPDCAPSAVSRQRRPPPHPAP